MTKVIGVLGDNIRTSRIYPTLWKIVTNPTKTPRYSFADDIVLNDKLLNNPPGEPIALVCGDEFGCGEFYNQAVSTLKGHTELTVIAKSVNPDYNKNAIAAGYKIIQCPTLDIANTDVNDDLDIQTVVVINKTKNKVYPIKP